ncbi:hypothetical protein BC833DRAFT_597864 [Globomyces pollinis-pini]|nr:hypothetical protein BC833DRAFT_597864 [Globomyces pollinis-pini]
MVNSTDLMNQNDPLNPVNDAPQRTISPNRSNTASQTYVLKTISFSSNGNTTNKCNIITQNINGPCPLIALCNILILRNDISIPLDSSLISYERISELVGEYLLSQTPDNTNNSTEMIFQQSLDDALTSIPLLQRGLDVNVHFNSANSFEFTSTLCIFDICKISMYHGWVVDEHDTDTFTIITKLKSYNAVVDAVIAADVAQSKKNQDNEKTDSDDQSKSDKLIIEGMICSAFLDETASQLTTAGLISIMNVLPENQLAIFFRNNHFSTILKRHDRLWMLVTDQGFAHSKVVWESLDNIHGNSEFLDENFKPYKEQNDEEVANVINNELVSDQMEIDLKFARLMQEKEDREFAILQQQQEDEYPADVRNPAPAQPSSSNTNRIPPQTANSSSSSINKKDKCIIQ